MKTAVITGADGGMGRIITELIALAGYKVIMGCIDLAQAKPVLEELQNKTKGEISLLQIDLSNLDSVERFVNQIKTEFHQFDLLLNNAGILLHAPAETPEGLELTAAVNYLGTYYLSNLMTPLMPEGSRIVNMASLSYKWFEVKDDFFEPVNSKKFNRFVHYSASKRAIVYFTMDYAEKMKEKHITVNCADPFIVSTPIISMGIKWMDKLTDLFFRPIIYSPAKGAATMIYLALAEEVKDTTGGYFFNKKQKKIPIKIRTSPQRESLKLMTANILEKLHKNL
ncbi:MAG: SDR family NAD(P)-dependent oxidoreductase [Bacteroidales bacterium]|jgi:NAD(P)-dependent dehydrogenase (short-subunit alcohol dehydrogenase family)|nr:SDR family NAD(P)-dependent oxidoreductase [Bacteroidales bacterium]